jgi:hypothetical protein
LWNDWHKDLLLKHLSYASTINFFPVGSLEHLDYINIKKSRPKRTKWKKIKVLLITNDVTVGASTPFANPQKHLETLHEIKKKLSEDKYDVIIKSHPNFDNYSIYDSIANECNNFKHIRYADLEKLVQWSHISILLNYPTTAVIIPLLVGCPAIYINSASYDLELWKCSLLEKKVFYVNNVNNLNQTIEDAIVTGGIH